MKTSIDITSGQDCVLFVFHAPQFSGYGDVFSISV